MMDELVTANSPDWLMWTGHVRSVDQMSFWLLAGYLKMLIPFGLWLLIVLVAALICGRKRRKVR